MMGGVPMSLMSVRTGVQLSPMSVRTGRYKMTLPSSPLSRRSSGQNTPVLQPSNPFSPAISVIICARIVRSLVGDRMSLLAQAFFAYALGFVLTGRLSLVMIATQPLSFYSRSVLMKSMSEKKRKAQREGSQLASEAVINHKTISAFYSQKRILGLFPSTLEGPKKESIRQSWFAGINLFSSQFLAAASTAVAYWYGRKLLADALITTERLFQAFLVSLFTAYTIAEVGSMAKDLSRRNNALIFKGLSRKISVGTSVALVGQSGSSKSTVIGLIESQEPTLFAGTIRENIAYGKKNAKESEIRKAAMLANTWRNGAYYSLVKLQGNISPYR
ncbi:hypothetical protein Acr_18g0006970 [Actinidia rufa]|uniref:ABC transmembrane type-1 domain-containing protein n=1 Tax=Actinidia rufa TaxID=165716 RepID=A0A7J0G6Y1_9ERIC|nr:hypothetical protein Acr_18g0006970 [Actinidia rufa]